MMEIVSSPEPVSESVPSPPEPPAPLVPEAPPAPAWLEAEAEAGALVAMMDETTQAQWHRWMEAIEAEVLRPLRTAVEQAGAAHLQFQEQAAFREELPADEQWRRAIAYRKSTFERVMAPLRAHLMRRNLGDVLGRGCLQVLDPLQSLVEKASSYRTLPRPITLYAQEDDDRAIRRARKAVVRGQRRGQRINVRLFNGLRRVFRLEPLPLPARGRLVPIRDLCAYHVQVRLPGRLIPLHEAVQRHVAHLVGRLETALTDWMHAVLDAERRLDDVTFHHPVILQSLHAPDADGPQTVSADPEGIKALAEAAETLQRILTDTTPAITLPALEAEDDLHTAADELEDDLQRAGTFLLKLNKRRILSGDDRPSTRIEARQQVWSTWHQQTINRLELNGHVMTLRREMLRSEDALLQRVSDAALRPVLRTFQPVADRLRQAEKQVAQACDAAATSGDLAVLKDVLQAVQRETLQAIQEALSDLPGLVSADQALAEPGRPEWVSVSHLVDQLPEHVLIHALLRAGKELVPEKRPWRMSVRMDVRDVLQPFVEHLSEPAQPLRKQIVRVWGETEQVAHIVQYNLDVALDELTAALVGTPPDAAAETEQPADPLKDARELATDGLRRAADTLMDLARSLEAPWQTFAKAVFAMFQKNWADAHRSVRMEAFVEEQWTDFWMRAQRWEQRTRRRSKELWQQYSRVALRMFRLSRRRAQVLIERGKSAIGTVEATEKDRLRTIDAISRSNVRALQASLPLVYRKLFSLRPVAEPSLLEGHRVDLRRITQHVERWKEGQSAGALMLAMPLGSGRTSLLNVVGAMLQGQADVRFLDLDKRIYDASDFAACVADALGIEVIGESSLEALENQILERARTDPPQVCLIDNLEHLLLRTFGGTDLVERVLIFFSRTDMCVCWINIIGDYTWRFLEKTLGTATGLVTAYTPARLDAASLEALIINRHRRSGMVLRFAEPGDLSPLVRRRLNRAKTTEAGQAILQEVFFDRLHRSSGQNVMLALFYWLRAADFEAEEGILTMKPVEPLSFRFFESFDLARAFTLKAFMLHNTLTLEEHNRIFNLTDAESTYLLESLLNLRLIEPCDPEAHRDAAGNASRILPGERYQLHPLILHPTLQLLRQRNIIH